MSSLYDLKKRLISAFSVIVFVLVLLSYSPLFVVKGLVSLIVAVIGGVGLWEYAQFSLAKGIKLPIRTLIGIGTAQILLGVAPLFYPLPDTLFGLGFVLATFILFLSHFKKHNNAIAEISSAFFGLCYVVVPLVFFLHILYLKGNLLFPNYLFQEGRWWLIYLLLITKISDAGAYFVGRLWGKHRLAPLLSPNKTWEGAIGGGLFSVIFSLFFTLLAQKGIIEGFHISFLTALVMGVVLAILGQLGDLAESLLKRDADIKDSNHLPGLGGVLDMMDSLFFTTPFLYYFLRF
jgi:phosphatidate cytidylyltransferase